MSSKCVLALLAPLFLVRAVSSIFPLDCAFVTSLTPIIPQALSLINHLLHTGSPNVFHYCQANIYVFKTLREFQYIDDNGVDVGINVRSEAKEVTRLLVNPEALKRGRNGRQRDYDEMINEGRRWSEEEDEAKRRQQDRKQKRTSAEEKDMQRAIQLSKEEEARRLQAIENSNKGGLFNDLERCVGSLTFLTARSSERFTFAVRRRTQT